MIRYAHIVVTFLFLLLIPFHPSFAQYDDLEFDHITGADGLPDNDINDIVQDYLGFIWIGTNSGLVKYDGFNMNTYCEKPNDTTQLIGSSVFSIYEDKDKNLWIGHSNGVSIYKRSMDSFQTYLYDPNNTESYGNAVANIFQDHLGRIWILTYSKGAIIMVKDSTSDDQWSYIISKQYLHNDKDSASLPSNKIWSAYETDKNVMWLGGFFGLSRYNSGTDNFTTYNVIKERKSTYPNAVIQIFQYKTEDIWFATYGDTEAFGIFNQETEETKFISLHNYSIEYFLKDQPGNSSNGIISEIVINEDGTFWIPSLGGGLMHFNPETGNFKSYIHNPQNPKSISLGFNVVGGLCKDYSGVIWFGETHSSLNKLSRPKFVIKHIKYDTNTKDESGLKKTIYQIHEDSDGILWLGTLEGLSRFDRKTGIYIHYMHDPKDPFSICNNRIIHILEDREGYLWFATNNGLSKFDKNINRFTNFYYNPNDLSGLPYHNLVCLVEDLNGDIYIGADNGILSKYVRDQDTFINYFKSQDQFSQSDTLGIIGEIRIDEEGFIWFTSGGNLNKFHPKKGLVKKYYFDDLFKEDNPSGLFYDSKGRFWMGRRRDGLLRFDKQTEEYKVYSINDGLPDEAVGVVLEDDNGNLWIRTGSSICRFDPDEEVFRKIIDLDSYQPLNTYAAFESTITGEMYFAGDGGLYIFHPDSIQDNPFPPRVVFTNIKVFNESIKLGKDSPLEKHINVAEQVKLNHWQNDFSIEFAALHFVDQRRNQYKYILKGYDENWREGDESRLARYTNMSPGEYLFRVIVSNSDGVWNEEGASIKIIILPPWWATTWAYILYILIILSIIYFTWKLQLKRVRIKHDYEMSKFEAEKMHEVDEMKTRFFTNISHEFRTPLTLIQGPAKQIIEKSDDQSITDSASLIHRSADKLNSLVDQLLDLSKLEAGEMTLRTSQIDVIRALKEIIFSFTPLAEKKKITLRFNPSKEQFLIYLDRDKFDKIITNILSNAFKFTAENGQISIDVSQKDKILEIKISDTGIGISNERLPQIFNRFYQVDGSHTREQEGTGIGLALTKELVELHKGKIGAESEESQGTTITIRFPLGKDHLKPEEIIDEEEAQEKPTRLQSEEVFEIKTAPKPAELEELTQQDKASLLIVEDNTDVRQFIRGVLDDDYLIFEAVDGEEGFNKAIEIIPDLIISDVMMPKMDGFEMCEKLKSDERTSHIPVIMLTAKATNKDKITGYSTGADDYIMKPFDEKVLQARVINLIEQRKKLREHFKKEGLFSIDDKELTPIDKIFLQKVIEVVNNHISDTLFGVELFASDLAVSRSLLHKKLVSLIGEPPSELIKRIRLTKAAKLLENKTGNISEIALEVGFNNPAYFSDCFRKQFGELPLKYQQRFSNH
jgi:signal transduction histidine kinase/ligand-binding sensor domain-containing protein/CheY-like chemotaxis protein